MIAVGAVDPVVGFRLAGGVVQDLADQEVRDRLLRQSAGLPS